MAFNKHERYGLTLGAEKPITASDVARKVSYTDPSYIEGIASMLNYAQSASDLFSALDLVWVPLGSTELITSDSYFPIKNFTTEYYMYQVRISGVKADSNNTIPTWVTSEDNGDNWDETAGDYAFGLWRQSQSTFQPNRNIVAPQIDMGLNVKLLSDAPNAIAEHTIFNPADPNKLTHGFALFTYIDYSSGAVGSFQRAEIYWSSQNLVAHTALALKCGSGVDWTTGNLGVWGLAV